VIQNIDEWRLHVDVPCTHRPTIDVFSEGEIFIYNKCKKTYQFKTRCKDDMVISDI